MRNAHALGVTHSVWGYKLQQNVWGTGCSSVGVCTLYRLSEEQIAPLLPPSQSFLENSHLAAGFGNHSLISGWKGETLKLNDSPLQLVVHVKLHVQGFIHLNLLTWRIPLADTR